MGHNNVICWIPETNHIEVLQVAGKAEPQQEVRPDIGNLLRRSVHA